MPRNCWRWLKTMAVRTLSNKTIVCPHCKYGRMYLDRYFSEWKCIICGCTLIVDPRINLNGMNDDVLLLADCLRNSFKNHNRKVTSKYTKIQRRTIKRLKSCLFARQVAELTGVSIATIYRVNKENI